MARPKGSMPFEVEERSGDRFADLGAAQRLTVHPLAADLATILQQLLAAGVLVNEGGRLVPNHSAEQPKA